MSSLPEPEAPPVPDGLPPGERPGDTIDRYTLLEELGEGGMGTVWLAQQSEPIRRDVALKVIKLGMDTREVVVRFEAERQALALMDHPHIAKVLDGGATQSGRPYFVMELVRGTPITAFCNTARMGLRRRLELFALVCDAVHHAHQKGIIHRDLKPSNVLVAEHDGEPVPKVIDFGIAKATSGELTQQTMHTEAGQILGTPEYMAPEQAGSGGVDIDTRADVYSLGMLLYEVLTGTKPFDVRKALELGFGELMRMIREVDPARPSTRVSTIGGSDSTVDMGRELGVEALGRRLRGDLDWIVMKAIDKDRERRYESSSALADDLRRYLNQEPVEAAPPSAAYRLRKLMRRRRKSVLAAAVILVLFVAGSVGTGVNWWRTRQANVALQLAVDEKDKALDDRALALAEKTAALDRETSERERAEENERRALQAEEAAEKRADELQQVTEFQQGFLSRSDPEAMGRHLAETLIARAPAEQRAALSAALEPINLTTVAVDSLKVHIIDVLSDAIDEAFPDQPLIRARLHVAMGDNQSYLSLYDEALVSTERALELFRAELGDEHEETVRALLDYGRLLELVGRYAEAEAVLRETLASSAEAGAVAGQVAVVAGGYLADLLLKVGRVEEAEEFANAAVEWAEAHLDEGDPNLPFVLSRLANVLRAQGRLEEAAEALETVARLLATAEEIDPQIQTRNAVATAGSLAAVYQELGRYEDANELYRVAHERAREMVGDDHPEALITGGNLAANLIRLGRVEEAAALYEALVPRAREVLHPDDPELLVLIQNLGWLYESQRRFVESEDAFREAYEGFLRVLGPRHGHTLGAAGPWGEALGRLGRSGEALPFLEEVLSVARESLGDHDATTLRLLGTTADALSRTGDRARAERLLLERVASSRELLGEDSPDTLTGLYQLGSVQRRLGKFTEARANFERAYEGRRRVLGKDHAWTLLAANALAITMIDQQEYAAAERLLVEIRPLVERASRADSGDYETVLINLGLALLFQERFEDGVEVYGELIGLFVERFGPRHSGTLVVRGNLGFALAGCDRHDEAVEHLTECVEIYRELVPDGDASMVTSLVNLCSSLLALDRGLEAETTARDALEVAERVLGPDHWRTAEARSLLGASLVSQGDFDEGLSLLLESYDPLSAALPASRRKDKLGKATERIASAYTAWHEAAPGEGHDVSAEEWRGRLEQLD